MSFWYNKLRYHALPWVPEVFLVWFPVSVMSVLVNRRSCQSKVKYFCPPRTRKNLWYPGYHAWALSVNISIFVMKWKPIWTYEQSISFVPESFA